MPLSPRKTKSTPKGKKRSANKLSDDLATSKIPRTKRSRRLSAKARNESVGSVTEGSPRPSHVDYSTGNTNRRERSNRLDRVVANVGQTEDNRNDEYPPDSTYKDDSSPPRSEPSTVTRDLKDSLGLASQVEGTTDEITAVPTPAQQESPPFLGGSIPLEGGAAAEVDESAADGAIEGGGNLDEAEQDEIRPVRSVAGDTVGENKGREEPRITSDKHEEALRTEGGEKDCDASPPRASDITTLHRRINELEGKIQSLEKNTDVKLDLIPNAVGNSGGGDAADMANIIHSLCHHLDHNVQSSSYIENKLLPLITVLNNGMHRRCTGRYIIDKLVRVLGNETTLDPNILNDVAKIIRVVLYSKSVGGKKDKKMLDDGELDVLSREMKMRMTWILINYIQSTPSVGTQTVSVGDETKVIKKPQWMESGHTLKKHVNEFYAKNRRRKSMLEKTGERDIMAEAIVRKINEFHVKGFARIRDRLRGDLMGEVWYIFDLDHIEPKRLVNPMDGPIDLRTIPLVKVPKGLNEKQKRKLLTKIWINAGNIIGDKATFTFQYEANVEMKSGEKVKKDVVRKVNFFALAALVLMKITGNGKIMEVMTYHEKSLYVISAIAQMLVAIVENFFVGKKLHALSNKEECLLNDESFHLLNVLEMMRPTQYETRKEIIDEDILNLDEEAYESVCFKGEEGSEEDEALEPLPTEECDSDSDDDEDGLFNGEEVDDAIAFLAR